MGKYDKAIYHNLVVPLIPHEVVKNLGVTQKMAPKVSMRLALTQEEIQELRASKLEFLYSKIIEGC